MNKISKEYIEKELASSLYKIEVYDSVESTNTLMKERAITGAEEFSVIIAAHQSAGRGRLGKSFHSPQKTGLYMSILLKLKEDDNPLLITTDAAVCCSRAFEKMTGKRAYIKWVNDIYMDNRKVCGILTEGVWSECACAVLGIGVNIVAPDEGFPDDIKDRAGCIFEENEPYLRERAAAEILKEFINIYTGRDREKCLNEYRERSMIIGKEIDIIRNDGVLRATALRVDDDYSLVVKLEDSTICNISSGDVSIRI